MADNFVNAAANLAQEPGGGVNVDDLRAENDRNFAQQLELLELQQAQNFQNFLVQTLGAMESSRQQTALSITQAIQRAGG